MSGIFWLASYPKSGNTWLRIFLTNYWRDADEPADINNLEGGPIAGARLVFDEYVGVEASDLTFEEIDCYRPKVYDFLAEQEEEPLYLKIHDAFINNRTGQPVVSAKATLGVIYLVRNPLDVTVSFAHHNKTSVEKMVESICRNTYALADNKIRLSNQLHQELLDWSGHVSSWVNSGLNVHVTRYEDMIADPEKAFTAILKFLSIPVDELKLRKAIRFSSFNNLKEMERKNGFREKAPKVPTFFRKGKAGNWREEMTEEQVNRIISVHKSVMKQFGYLDDDEHPVF